MTDSLCAALPASGDSTVLPLRGAGLGRRLWAATRPMFFPASLVPVLAGSSWGQGALHWGDMLLCAVGMMLLHAGANVMNDVADSLNGGDAQNNERIFPFTGGSRLIQNEILSLRVMAVWGAVLLLAAALTGLVLARSHGPGIILYGLLGGGLALAYSLPPLFLAGRGLGEAAVALGFGLPVLACCSIQGGTVWGGGLLAALAVGGWSAAILLVNEIPDVRADAACGKRTLVVRLGVARCWRVYAGIQTAAALALLGAGLLTGGESASSGWRMLPGLLLGAGGLLIAAGLAWRQDRMMQSIAIRATLAIHALGGVSLCLFGLLRG